MTRLLPLLAIMALFLASVSVVHAQTTAPTVFTVAVTSDPGTDDTYALGDTIEVGLTFDEAVTVTGDPYLLIDVGGTNRRASYQSGSGATQLLFQYTVLAYDDDDDGIAVVTNSLTLNGGTIVATDDSTAATLDHAALTTTAHKVDIIVTLLSNFGQTESPGNATVSATNSQSLVFTTGGKRGGYQLNSVVLDVKSASATLQVEVQIQNPDNNDILATLTGSVTSAGPQTFTAVGGADGNLKRDETYRLRVVGSGTGTVALGRVVAAGEDSGGSDGWDIPRSDDFLEGDDPNSFHYLKVDIKGHDGAIPYLLGAWIYNTPYDGSTFTAGERVEIYLGFSASVQTLDRTHTVPLWLGNGEQNLRSAKHISTVNDARSRLYYVYIVQPGDTDTDGVLLGSDISQILTQNGEPAFANAFYSNVPARAYSLTEIQSSVGSPADGSRPRACQQLFCGYLEAQWGAITGHPEEFVFNQFAGNDLNSTSFGYAGEEHNISYITNFLGETPSGNRVELFIDFQGAPSRRLIERASFELGDLILPLRDAERSILRNESIAFKWFGDKLSRSDGDRFSVRIVENVDVSFGSDTYTVDEDGTAQVEVTLNADLERDVTVPITVVNQDGATDADYTAPADVTFVAGETSKSFVITPVDDSVDDDDETLKVLFGTLPETMRAHGTTETVVTIVDNDDPQVEVNFRRTIHDVAEGASQTVTVNLTADPERTVVVPLTATDRDGATSADYAAIPASVTFDPGDTSKTFTFTATDDAIDDDGEKVLLEFGTLPDGVTPGTVPTSTVSIIDDDAPASVAVSWAQTTYSVAEGGSVTVTAELDDDPEKTVVVPIARTDQGGAGSGDYSGVPSTITFDAGDTSKTFTFSATDDALDDDDESVQLTFGPTLPSGVTQGTPAGTVVRITDDDDPEVNVSYGQAEYTAAEGGSVTVTVKLDADPERTVVIPVTHTARAGATIADYSGVPANVTFDAGDTSKTFTLSATDDTVDDDDEEVLLGFGTLPTGVSAGTVKETLVSITDDDDPQVEVNFRRAIHDVAEGADRTVTVKLTADPERTVVVPLTATDQDGASSADYSVPDSVTFESGETTKDVTFTATDDAIDDDEERVLLGFGTLPDGVTPGTVPTSTVSIIDDDTAGVTIDPTLIAVVSGQSNEYTVVLDSEPTGDVTVTITGHAGTDLSLDKSVLTFTAADWDSPQTVKVTAAPEATTASVTLSHSVSGGDYASVSADPVTVTIAEVSGEELTIQVGVTTSDQVIPVPEGGSNTYSLLLSSRPASNVTISVSLPSGNDLSIDLLMLNFTTTNWATPQTVTITASEDDDAVTDDAVLIIHTMISGGSAVIPSVRATITEKDSADLVITPTPLAVPEGDVDGATYTIALASEPTGDVTVTISGHAGTDLSLDKTVLTLTADDWDSPQTVKVTAAHDDDAVDDPETLTHTASGADYDSLSKDLPVTITDDAPDDVKVSFGSATYTATEGGTVEVTVTLDLDPERQVTIPLTATDQDGATSGDYAALPASVTFDPGDTSKTFTFTATDDALDDDDESVQLAFGPTLPSGVTQGTPASTLVRITDNDDPQVTVSYGLAEYTAAEGSSVTVTVELDADPERTVVIPVTHTARAGATSADYSGVPESVTFDSGDTSKTFTFSADDDTVDDDDEEVLLGFGTLPTGVSAGTVKETVVSITDDDDPEVKVSFGADQYTVAEGGTVEVTVTLDEDPERTVVIPLARENLGETSDSDYSGVPESVTFGSGDTSRTFTVAAVDDKLRDSGEELKLTFGTLPSGVSEGSLKEARVTITDSQVQGELTVGFGLGAITVAEGGTAPVTVSLSEAPGSDVTIPLTATGQDGATSSDYSGVPESVTFESSDTEQTFTFTAVDDTVDDDGESVLLAFGTLPSGVLAGTVKETLVSITDDDLPASLTVNFGADRYTVAEGGTVEVTVTLDDDPERTVVIPVTAAGQDGATSSDYSGVPQNVTFDAGDTSKTFTITAADDAVDDDDESVKLAFGTLPENLSPGTTTETVVTIVDNDDPQVEVNFRRAIHDVAEGADRTVTVKLTADPERTVVIPLTATDQDGASSADYSVPDSVTFESGETTKDVTFTATDDTIDDDGEKVLLEFGTLPDGVTPGTVPSSTVSIIDDDDPEVKVSFAQSSYTTPEGATVSVVVELDADPERSVTIPITATPQDGASSTDYSVPDSVTFDAGETSRAVVFTATMDDQDDDDESVQLAFGPTLPTGVTEGTPSTTTVSITDDDLAGDRLMSLVVAPKDIDGFDPEVTGYMVGVASTVTQATITATPAYEDATVAIDGTAVNAGSAHAVDLSAGLNTFEVVVTSVDNDQATYTVYIGRGTTGQGGWKAGDDLDTLRAAGNTEPNGIWSNGTTIWVADVSNARLYAYSQAGGARDGDKDIAVNGVIMAPTGIWSDGATIWVIGPVEMTAFAHTLGSGARDSDSDISLGSDLMLPVDMWSDGVTMWVLDSHDDKLYAYTLADDTRDSDKDIDLAGENAAPLGVWSNGTTIWVTDRDDRKVYAYNFSGERVAGHDIDLHSRNADAGAIWGNDDTLWVANDINDVSSPFNRVFTYNNVPVTVTFGQSSYTVAESDDTSTTDVAENAVQVTVTLSADPKRQVVVPITATRQGTVTGTDYSGVPANLTFESGETEKSFTFTATHDTLDDDDESVHLTFGMLPQGVTRGTNSEAVVSITDDDIGVSFERMGYETTEGESVDVKVTLSSPATREVTIPLDADKQGGASDDDYSGVQDSITFQFSDTETSIKFTAVDDEVDDDGEKVRLRFGTLPTGLVPGPNVEATITITDNDMPTDRLMSLVVAPKDIDGFDPEVTDYMVGVASTVTQATITATPHRPDDTVTINGAQVTGGSAHTVDLSVGLNTFAVVVDSAVTQEQSTYTVYIGRGTAVQGGWKAGDDLDTLRSPGNASPTGAWSNGVTMWIADSNDGKLYAYTLADGARDADKDITLESNNSNPVGIWSDDTTIWVAQLMPTERKVYAYTLADGARDSDQDITLRGDNTTSWGVWSDGTTMWVVDWNGDDLYAYTLADDTRDSDQDLALSGDNTSPRGIWSDGTTIWVVDSSGAKLYAYALSDGVRVEGYDIGLHSSNAGAGGIWANDDTAWVVNSATEDGSPFDRVFTYNNIPVEVSFQSARYTVAESGSVTVKVTLSADPKRTVVIPLTATDQDGATAADYSGVPESLTFVSGETTKDITFTAEMDDVDDDGESVLIGFGTTLPAGVTAGSPSAATVTIDDDDDPQVEVNFYRSIYDVAEGGNVTITVNLSADPERTVVVPLTATDQDGATSADYAALPASVTFDPGDTSKTFTFSATDDTIDDDGESVLLEFGTLPDGVTPGTVPTSAVSITDDDAPASVTVSFGADRYSATEGGDDAVVTVVLGSPAEGQVEIPLTDNGHGGATEDDWSGVPETVTFDKGDDSKSFTVTAVDDNVEDNGEMVELGFGTLPAGFAPGSPSTARIILMNDDGIETTGQNRVCTNGEITVRGQTDRWLWRITGSDYWDEYTIDLMGLHSNKGTLRDPHIVYITQIYTHDGFYPPAGSASGSFPSYASNDRGVGWDSSSQLRFRNRTGSYSYFPGKEQELDTGYYTALVGSNPFGDGANGLGSYTLCIEGPGIEGPGSISAVDQPERRIVVSAAHVDVSDGEPAQFSIKLGARPTGPVEVFMTKLEPASDSQYVVEPLIHSFTADNWDIPQVATVRQKADYATPKDDGFAIHYWGKGGGYHKAFEFLEVYDRVPRWMTLRSTVDPEPALTEPDSSGQQANSPAAGGPGIQGVARAGETLTATTSGIRDDDGLDNAVFAHQWVRSELGAESGTDIAGAMRPSYVVTSEDEGKAITVRVTFTDDAGNEESVISYAVVAATALPQTRAPDAPGAPDVSAHDSTSLAVTWTAPASDGGSAITGYKVQWKEAADSWDTPEDVSEEAATGSSHTITGLTDGTEYSVRVLAINDIGEGLPSDDGGGTPRETVPPEVSEASVDEAVLTLTFSEALDENAEPATTAFTVTVSGNVRAVDSVNVSGSAVTLTLASAVTSQDTVTVSYTVPGSESAERLRDAVGNAAASFADESVTNDTAPAAPAETRVPDAPGAPEVSAHDSTSLAVTWTEPASDGGSAITGYRVQWKEAADSWDTPADVSEAEDTGTSHTITGLTDGTEYSVRVIAVNSVGDGPPSPEATGTPAAGDSASGSKGAQGTPAEGSPAITGEPTVGETLRADTSGISDEDGMKKAVFTYQWVAGGADIDGATGASHILTEDEEGLAVQVWVSFTDDAGNPEAVTSVGTAAVSPANTPASGMPAITGILRDGETLTADTSGISDEERMDNAVFTYRWMAGGTDIDGATGSTYTLTADEVGAAISVWVSFTDDAGNPEAVTSALTEAVAPRPPLTAQFLDTPGSHDGQSEFTFELRFSETPRRGFSYETLRDHAFTVTGGEVVRARRLEPGKNVRWEIHVRPDSNAAVTIVLPATTDCEAEGAICTGDGRMLSERVELTVSGPNG